MIYERLLSTGDFLFEKNKNQMSEIQFVAEQNTQYLDHNSVVVLSSGKMPGGQVLRSGAGQEEVMYLMSPELLVSRLVMEKLEENEAVLVQGSEVYNTIEAQEGQLKFTGNYTDTTPLLETRKQTAVLSLDAQNYSEQIDSSYQYKIQ